jgi:hypothetical protein
LVIETDFNKKRKMSQDPQQQQASTTTAAASGVSTADSSKQQQVSPAELSALMQAQGLPISAQTQIMAAVMGSNHPPAGSTVDMASVLAKIQVCFFALFVFFAFFVNTV